MFISNLFIAFAGLLDLALSIFVWLIIIRALISWFNPDPYNVLYQFLYQLTKLVFSLLRTSMPNLGGIDISPIIVLLAIEFLRTFLVQSLLDLSRIF